jgi:phosphate transport system substrate-binding protein
MPRSDRPIFTKRSRRRTFGRIFLVALGLAVAALIGSRLSYAETIRTGGTGAALGTMRILGDAFEKIEPQLKLAIVSNLGSGGGLKALEHGALHFALVGRPLTQAEYTQGLKSYEYGRTPFVIASGHKQAQGLTLAQIADIYGGRFTRWPDGTPVRVVLRPGTDADTPLLASFSPLVKENLARAMSRAGMITAVTDQESADEIGRLRGGVGTSTLALIVSERRKLTPLSIDGVAPTVENLANGTYRYAKPLYLVTRGEPSPAVARFVRFMQSAEGRRILADTGHWVPGSDLGTQASKR